MTRLSIEQHVGGGDVYGSQPADAAAFDMGLVPPAQGAEALSPAVLDIKEIPGLPAGFFNAAAWREGDDAGGRTFLLGRQADGRSPAGMPDISRLLLVTLGRDGVEQAIRVWEPEPAGQGDLLEDPRAVRLSDGRLILGYTRLMYREDGKYAPFPAFSVGTTDDLLSGRFPPTYPVTNLGEGGETVPIGGGPNMYYLLSGKNVTPFGSGEFMFRPEHEDHRLLIFGIDAAGAAQDVRPLDFPPGSLPAWAKRRIGSTMPPVWLNDKEAVFIFHGIEVVGDRSVYSIGSARLLRGADGQYTIDNIGQEPVLTTKSFEALFPGQQVQLRPEERDALYACGGVVGNGASGAPELITIYPNVGDTRTVEAILSIKEITKGWIDHAA